MIKEVFHATKLYYSNYEDLTRRLQSIIGAILSLKVPNASLWVKMIISFQRQSIPHSWCVDLSFSYLV